ncbi:MAG: hypothetical protein CMK74_20890 [Pseudomonadales bacterium]|nr:hypothetical protein [Pseudomonadales bacterium]|tara:strand:- start:2134 stop:3747 length:1614 start_codon:yes stop_codon:yes gene_type:complete
MKEPNTLPSSEKYHLAIEDIKNQLSNYSPISVLKEATNQLEFCNTLDSHIEGMPWIILFTLKLSMMNGESSKPAIRKEKFDEIVDSVYAIQHIASDIDEGDVMLKLRAMILQQAWYQNSEAFHMSNILRQNHWFTGKNKYYEEVFSKSCGLSLESYFLISTYLIASLSRCRPNVINVNIGALVKDLCPKVKIKDIYKFLMLVATPANELHVFFKSHKIRDKKNKQSEYFQPTPIRYRPIIFSGNSAYTLSKTILCGGLASIVVDRLKLDYKEEFKTEFGKDMEEYVGELLSVAKIESLNEENIKKLFRKNSIKIKKITDYFIDGDTPILIECKAIEPGDIVKSSFERELLAKNLKDSFIKSVNQGQETAAGLKQLAQHKEKKFIHLVVTHEDFWIATGAELKSIYTELSPILGDDGVPVLELERVIFMPISSLETLLEEYMRGEANIIDILETFIDRHKTVDGRRMTTSQAISELLKNHPMHSLLKEASIFWVDKVGETIKANNEHWSKPENNGELFTEYTKLIVNLRKGYREKLTW